MPKLVLTCEEEARVESVLGGLDGEIQEFFDDLRNSLVSEQWELLLSYSRACARRVLEVGLLLHAVVDAQGSRGIPYNGRGRAVFVRQGLAAWRDSFAPVADVWQLVPIFEAVPGGERRVMADVATLEVMASNRMFESLDQQRATFFPA